MHNKFYFFNANPSYLWLAALLEASSNCTAKSTRQRINIGNTSPGSGVYCPCYLTLVIREGVGKIHVRQIKYNSVTKGEEDIKIFNQVYRKSTCLYGHYDFHSKKAKV